MISIPSELSVSRINVEGTYNLTSDHNDTVVSFKYRTDFSIKLNDIDIIKFSFLDLDDSNAVVCFSSNTYNDNFYNGTEFNNNELIVYVTDKNYFNTSNSYTLYANSRIDKIMVKDRYDSDFHD